MNRVFLSNSVIKKCHERVILEESIVKRQRKGCLYLKRATYRSVFAFERKATEATVRTGADSRLDGPQSSGEECLSLGAQAAQRPR